MEAHPRLNTMSPKERLLLASYASGAVVFLLLLSVMGALRAGFFQRPALSTAQDIRLVVHSPLSGPQSAMGREIRNGVALAVADVGGTLAAQGFRLTLVAYDDVSNADAAVANAERIGRDPAVLAVIGHINAGQAVPASQRYARAGLAFITPASSSMLVATGAYSNTNRLLGIGEQQSLAAAEFIQDDLEATTVYIVGEQTLYGVNLAQSFITHADRLGLVISGTAILESQDAPQLAAESIAQVMPDVVFFSGAHGALAQLITAFDAAGVEVPIVATDGADAPELADVVAATSATVYYLALALPPASHTDQYPAAEGFVAAYQASFGYPPGLYAAEAYDAARLAIAAIERAAAGSPGLRPPRAQVVVELRRATLYGLRGRDIGLVSGELRDAEYFVLEVAAASAAEWAANPVIRTVFLPPIR